LESHPSTSVFGPIFEGQVCTFSRRKKAPPLRNAGIILPFPRRPFPFSVGFRGFLFLFFRPNSVSCTMQASFFLIFWLFVETLGPSEERHGFQSSSPIDRVSTFSNSRPLLRKKADFLHPFSSFLLSDFHLSLTPKPTSPFPQGLGVFLMRASRPCKSPSFARPLLSPPCSEVLPTESTLCFSFPSMSSTF